MDHATSGQLYPFPVLFLAQSPCGPGINPQMAPGLCPTPSLHTSVASGLHYCPWLCPLHFGSRGWELVVTWAPLDWVLPAHQGRWSFSPSTYKWGHTCSTTSNSRLSSTRELLDCKQQRATKVIKELEYLSSERLRDLRLFSLEKTRFRRRLISVYRYLKDRCNKSGARFFSVVPVYRTRGNGHRQEHRRFFLNNRMHLFTVRVLGH